MRTVGRYEILGEIGRGGTATVYRARDTDSGETVALKDIGTDALRRRCIEHNAGLAHPNILAVREVIDDGGTAYLAMDYLERGSLRPLLQGLTAPQFAGILLDVLAGLAYLAGRGIV